MLQDGPWLAYDMASNPLHHDQPAYRYVLHMYMNMLDAVGTSTKRPDASTQNHMWNMFLKDLGIGYDQHHRLEVQDAQRFLVACLRHGIPT